MRRGRGETGAIFPWEIAPERVWFIVTDNGSTVDLAYSESFYNEVQDVNTSELHP